MKEVYTLWVSQSKIGTYETKELAEKMKRNIEANIKDLTHIQKWTPVNREATIDGAINWRSYKDMDCMPEGDYLLEVDLASGDGNVVTKVVRAYYIKETDMFVDEDANFDDLAVICREDIVRWAHYKPPTESEVFDE
jgi:hypothetical protein